MLIDEEILPILAKFRFFFVLNLVIPWNFITDKSVGKNENRLILI